MPDRLTDKLQEYLEAAQGRMVNLKDIRVYLKIEPGSTDDQNLRKLISTTMVKRKIVSPSGRNDGIYKVIRKVKPVSVFGGDREVRPPFPLVFPKDFDTMMEMFFAEDIVIREHDCITIGGQSNYGKTCLAINFCGENIDRYPVLMGNEYTQRKADTDEYEATQRFTDRLNTMDWVTWCNGNGVDKFTLLPVKEDYPEHIIKDRINIIDWINLDADRLYDISRVMDNIKAELGRGIAIVVLQKGEGNMARGGQFTKDFTDCELLIDRLSDYESLLTIGKVKEHKNYITGRTFAFGISKGIRIINFREVDKCKRCGGKKTVYDRSSGSYHPCDTCKGTGYTEGG